MPRLDPAVDNILFPTLDVIVTNFYLMYPLISDKYRGSQIPQKYARGSKSRDTYTYDKYFWRYSDFLLCSLPIYFTYHLPCLIGVPISSFISLNDGTIKIPEERQELWYCIWLFDRPDLLAKILNHHQARLSQADGTAVF